MISNQKTVQKYKLNLKNNFLDIAREFEKEEVVYAIGASYLLLFSEIDVEPSDLDIFVTTDDFNKACEIISAQMEGGEIDDNHPTFRTERFAEFRNENLEIDLISGMKVQGEEHLYEYKFDNECIERWIEVEDLKLPLLELSDMFVLYTAMGRAKKAIMISESPLFYENDIKWGRHLLTR